MIRTIIVDDELLAGVGIQSLIHEKQDITVSGVFNSAADAVDFLRENMIDVVITDIEMGDMSGLELIRIIREEHLADGIIILSCHDDFSYAQEAISRGTDGYLLKHSVTQQSLIGEIEKVYGKYREGRLPGVGHGRHKPRSGFANTQELLRLGIICLSDYVSSMGEQNHVDGTMLIHLLEGIVSRYRMGTLYAPYNREIFVIFEQTMELSRQEREENIRANMETIRRNIQQYINSDVYFGISPEFGDHQQIHEKYDEAFAAVQMRFYEPGKNLFFYREGETKTVYSRFSMEHFLEDSGLTVFSSELRDYLNRAGFHRMPVRDLRVHLIHAVGKMVYQVLDEHQFSEKLSNKWSSDAVLVSAITQAKSAVQLEQQVTEVMGQFRQEALAELEEDDLSVVLEYIEGHFNQKLQLSELAEMGYMSVPTFGKRFKERTGMTLVQYLNERRIERAKVLLKNSSYSLEEIAAETGFSNANYLIRVFKKVTGRTVSEYRG